MADALSIASVVDTLVEMDLVDLNGTGPWPGEPEGVDVYEPDWSQIHPAQSDLEDLGHPPSCRSGWGKWCAEYCEISTALTCRSKIANDDGLRCPPMYC